MLIFINLSDCRMMVAFLFCFFDVFFRKTFIITDEL